jgi:hypothetical protein
MDSSTEVNADLRAYIRHQEIIADLSQQVLETDTLDHLLHGIAVAVTDTLDTDYCTVLDLVLGTSMAKC